MTASDTQGERTTSALDVEALQKGHIARLGRSEACALSLVG